MGSSNKSKLRFNEWERNEVAQLVEIILGNESAIRSLSDDKDQYACFAEGVMSAVNRALVVCEVYRLKSEGRGHAVRG